MTCSSATERAVSLLIKGLAFSTILLIIAAGHTEPRPEEIEERFLTGVYRSSDGFPLSYRLLAPDRREAGRSYPLVLFLHGSDERGDDNWKQLHVGLHIFADPEKMERYPCFILAPQCPEGMMWADVDWKSERHSMKDEPTPTLDAAYELIESLVSEHPIDGTRIYITGYSMGGFGVWDAIQRWPDYFAAAVPVCGGGDESAARRIAQVPIWAFHGALDPIVKVTRTRKMIHALVSAGGVPRYTEYPDINHFSWGYTYGDDELFKWLFRQKLRG